MSTDLLGERHPVAERRPNRKIVKSEVKNVKMDRFVKRRWMPPGLSQSLKTWDHLTVRSRLGRSLISMQHESHADHPLVPKRPHAYNERQVLLKIRCIILCLLPSDGPFRSCLDRWSDGTGRSLPAPNATPNKLVDAS